MTNRLRINLVAIILTLALVIGYANAQTINQKQAANHPTPATQAKPVAAAGSASSVTGSGTAGQLTKWLGSNGTSYTIGDSIITEDKFGRVGIGTVAPTSKLTVQGMIETTLGGVKFPDGTVQTSAAIGLSSIFHNATLTGSGTSASPLGVAIPLTLSGAVFGDNVAGGDVLRGVINVTNTAVRNGPASGSGLQSQGPNSINGFTAGQGVVGFGGNSENATAGEGVRGFGGFSSGDRGGTGVVAIGGDGGERGGFGITAFAGHGPLGDGAAGSFFGVVGISSRLDVGGSLNVSGTKNFKIDHPLDPENKYLYHAAIESSEVLNVYSGNVTTNEQGEATVNLPAWFEAINRDFRYQLTVVGTFAQAIVGNEIQGNRFTIRTNAPGVKVSWQVTGVRSDQAMRKHPFQVETDKTERERGFYLNPEAFGQPEARGIEWAHHPELMKQVKDRRAKNQ